jgi:7-keto-8-aminopelargonate synthetase-like enzyme
MLFDAPLAQRFAARLNELGVLVTGFFYPVVPMGQARVPNCLLHIPKNNSTKYWLPLHRPAANWV